MISGRRWLKTCFLLFFFGALFIHLSFFVACSNFDEPTVKKGQAKPKPAGKIYFRLKGLDSIYYLDAESRQFNTVPISLNQLWDFDISADGNWLLVAHGSRVDRFNLLKFRKDYSQSVQYPLRGKISVGPTGRVVVYETEFQGVRRIAVLYVETGENFILASAHDGAAFAPQLTPSGQAYAWTQYDGLYFAKINQTKPVQLTRASLVAEDFSPTGTYLAAGGELFDVRALTKYPGEHGGRLRFIDDYFLIQQKPMDSDSLQKINISGTEHTFLFKIGRPIIDFTISDGQRFVVALGAEPDAQNILFYIYDFVDLEDEFSILFPRQRGQTLGRLLWPKNPTSLSQHD